MNIVIVRMGAMGDLLLTTPTVRALAQRYPDAQIDYILGPGLAPTLDGLPYLNRVIVFDKRRDWGAGLPAFLRPLRQRRYDLLVNLQPSIKTRTLAWGIAPTQRLTFRKDQRPQKPTGRLRHATDDFGKTLAPLGIAVAERQMDFVVPDGAKASATALLQEGGIAPGTPFVAVNPGASHPVNRWPAERFGALLDTLACQRPDLGRVLLGGPGDRALTDAVRAAARCDLVDLSGRLSIKELGAVIGSAQCLVTGDTGPQHIAAALQTPLVSLFGPADPDRTGPTSSRDLVVVHQELSCRPCRKRSCRRGDLACFTQMPVEWVFDALQRRLRS